MFQIKCHDKATFIKIRRKHLKYTIDLFIRRISDKSEAYKSRSIRSKNSMEVELCAASYPLWGSNTHKLQRTSLKLLRILSCDPMCQIRKISSLFGTLGHKQSIITPPVNRSSAILPVDVSRWCVSIISIPFCPF